MNGRTDRGSSDSFFLFFLINRKNWQNLAKAANRALRIELEDEEVQRSPWHEEVHTQAQNPGRILCDYGTPW